MEGEYFCPRPELERQLRAFAESGQNVVIQGERRMGKTSLIRHAVGGMRRMRMVYADLYCIRTAGDFCRRVMGGIARADDRMPFLRKAMSLVHRLRPALSFDPSTGAPQISVDARAAESPEAPGTVMEMLRKIAEGGQTCVVFDEFQDILDLEGAEGILAEMRSSIQFQAGTPYFFSGSVRNDMARIFDDSGSPFFKSAVPFTVGAIERGTFARFVAERFRKGGRQVDMDTAGALVDYADGVSGDVQEICEAIWDTTEAGARVTVEDVPKALKLVFSREGAAFGETVRQLTPLQTAVLRALAEEGTEGVFSGTFMQRVGTTSTGGLRTALGRLVARRIVYPYGGRYRFANPFFKVWLRTEL